MILVILGGITVAAIPITSIWDEESESPLPFTWNFTNFDGFNVSGIGTENLSIVQTNLGASAGKTRTIRNWEDVSGAGLIYNTTRYLVEYEVSKNKGLSVEHALNSAGYKVYCGSYPWYGSYCGNYYARVNLLGEPYIALNGKANKLTKLVLEQKSSESKMLNVGETWKMGGGWTITAQSIDARATPRQVWLVLVKDGIKKDDRVIAQGQVYTYVEKSIAGESDVPLFATYVDSVFAGTAADLVVLKYTWLVSTNITEVKAGDRYGLLKTVSSFENEIKFDNDCTISLASNTTVNLAGNMKFKVIENVTYLKFYPAIEPRLNITASSASIPAGTPANVLFTVTSNGLPVNGAMVRLSGAAVESAVTGISGHASIIINATYSGTIIAEAEKGGYASDTTTIQAYSLPEAAMTSWNLQENYVLNLTDIDIKAAPRQARLQLSRNEIVIKDSVVTQHNMFEYCPSYSCIFNATIEAIFNGTQGNLVKLINANQNSESTGMPLLTDAVYLYKSMNFSGMGWKLDEGYELRMMDIDTKASPRLVWLEISKNDTILDDAILSWGQKYFYNHSGLTILTAKVDAIFRGETASIVKLREINQYSETSGAVLLNNSTHSFISGVINKIDQSLYEGYTISILGIDAFASPRLTWIRLNKNNAIVDEKIAMQGEVYRYYNQSNIILYAEVSAIFAGSPVSAVQLRNVTQYSEINGNKLIDGATYTIITNGYPLPIPVPTVTPIPTYGTYEVHGTAASEIVIAGEFNVSNPPVIWTPHSFAGLYYDLKENLGKEELNIKSIDIAGRNIPKGAIYYKTSMLPKMLSAVKQAFGGDVTAASARGLKSTGSGQAFEDGNYQIVGWQGEKYVALNGKINKLVKLVLEHGQSAAEKKTLITGETWDIGDGWTITAQSIDTKATPRQAWLVLGKDGIKKDEIIVSQGEVFTYVENSLENESEVPLFLTYLDSVFAGATSNMAQLRYTWVISTNVTTIHNGDRFGELEVDSISLNLTLKNKNSSINLSKDGTVDIMGNLKFRVADNNTLRFMPIARLLQPERYDVQGTAWNETPFDGFGGTGNIAVWNVSNFAGFFYDIDNNIGNESLQVLQKDLNTYQRTIDINNLVYSTYAQPKRLNVVKKAFNNNVRAAASAGLERTGSGEAFENGNYYIAGWQGDKYVALNGNIGKIAKLVVEQAGSESKTLAVGGTWNIGSGWTLTVQSIDTNKTPKQVLLVLSKDGVKKDEKLVTSGTIDAAPVYTYVENSIAGEVNVPLFVTYIDDIFTEAATDKVAFRYTWAISPEQTTIHGGDRFGIFTVVDLDTANKHIGLKNRDTAISLNQDTVNLIGNLRFRVMCDMNYWGCVNVLRFTPEIVRAADISIPQLRGDINRNGRRDTGDATLILRSIVGLPIPSQYMPILPIGDMNCNNRIDTGDATLVLRDVVGLPIPRCWE